MILYRYMKCEPFEYVLDVILNERLYCASVEEFNDPMEGLVQFNPYDYIAENSAPLDREISAMKQLALHREYIKEYRVCSLSKRNDDILLWSHYCGGHAGLCIECDVPSTATGLHEVIYVANPRDHEKAARYMPMHYLTHKLKVWENEQEVRIIQREAYYNIQGRIRRLILGSRLPQTYFDTIEKTAKERFALAVAYIHSDTGRMMIHDLAL